MTLGSLLYLVATSFQRLASWYQHRSASFGELTYRIVARTTLSDKLSVPSTVIVQINHDVCAGLERGLDERIVCGEETCVEGRRSLVPADEVLPADGDSDPGVGHAREGINTVAVAM